MKKKNKKALPLPTPKNTGSKIKTAILVILVLAAAVVIFLIGIVKANLNSNEIAVFYSKASGYDLTPIYPGDFKWKWQKLLPGNSKILKFSVDPIDVQIDRKGELPSGDVYGIHLDGNPDFSFELKAKINYKLKPESLPVLCQQENLTPESIAQWYADMEFIIAESAVKFIQESGEDEQGLNKIAFDFSTISADLTKALEKKHPAIKILSVTAEKIIFPDIELYFAAKETYLSLLQVQTEMKKKSYSSISAKELKAKARVEILSQYGEVFAKHPELLQIFSIPKETADELLPDLPVIKDGD